MTEFFPVTENNKKLAIRSSLWLIVSMAVLGSLLFLSAGTLDFWEAWLYLLNLSVVSIWMTLDLLSNNPELLEQRLRTGEKDPAMRKIMALAWVWLFLTFLTPGLDQRLGISYVPAILVMIADMVVGLAYGLIWQVLRVNSYASRLIEVEAGQTVVTSGPYARIRHPMYLGGIIVYLFTPLALGSWLAIFPAVFIIPILVARIRHEEAFLMRRLPGYREYMASTPYRIIPGIW